MIKQNLLIDKMDLKSIYNKIRNRGEDSIILYKQTTNGD